MADRTSAYLFGKIFDVLANELPAGETRNKLAHEFWGMSREYDFSACQMGADEALFKLGLARRGVDPGFPEDGVVVLYGPSEDRSDE